MVVGRFKGGKPANFWLRNTTQYTKYSPTVSNLLFHTGRNFKAKGNKSAALSTIEKGVTRKARI